MSYEDMDGIRRSDLWVIKQSPLHFRFHMDNQTEAKSKALVFGAAAHKFILEPNDFENEYAVIPSADRRTKEGRAIYQLFEEKCKQFGLTAISADDMAHICDMADALKRNELASQLLEGLHEASFSWIDDLTGEHCKCRVDCLTTFNEKPYIVDYKTTDSCEDGHFERSARKYGYQFQAGMYCEGLFQNTLQEYGFAFVAQEKNPPYAVRVYICDQEWIKRGYDTFRELIGIYHDCKQTGNWYGYEGPDGIPVELMED